MNVKNPYYPNNTSTKTCESNKQYTTDSSIGCFNPDYERDSIDALYDHLKEVYHKKNHDYGNSFAEGLDEDGLIFAKMHLMEKYKRFKQLITEPNLVNGEGIRDSLLDMANYAVMTVDWIDKNSNKIK